jgi:hypothetical protein
MGYNKDTMKWNWYIDLTASQYSRLRTSLKTYFRFQIVLAIETIEYNRDKKLLTVLIPEGIEPKDIQREISAYINGFGEAIQL